VCIAAENHDVTVFSEEFFVSIGMNGIRSWVDLYDKNAKIERDGEHSVGIEFGSREPVVEIMCKGKENISVEAKDFKGVANYADGVRKEVSRCGGRVKNCAYGCPDCCCAELSADVILSDRIPRTCEHVKISIIIVEFARALGVEVADFQKFNPLFSEYGKYTERGFPSFSFLYFFTLKIVEIKLKSRLSLMRVFIFFFPFCNFY
jgi:hypothetical protein